MKLKLHDMTVGGVADVRMHDASDVSKECEVKTYKINLGPRPSHVQAITVSQQAQHAQQAQQTQQTQQAKPSVPLFESAPPTTATATVLPTNTEVEKPVMNQESTATVTKKARYPRASPATASSTETPKAKTGNITTATKINSDGSVENVQVNQVS
jgi:type II secretory pathway pseudopilin PulG